MDDSGIYICKQMVNALKMTVVCIYTYIYIYIYAYSKYVMDDSGMSGIWTSNSNIWRVNESYITEKVNISDMSLPSITYFIYQVWH